MTLSRSQATARTLCVGTNSRRNEKKNIGKFRFVKRDTNTALAVAGGGVVENE